MAIRKWDRVGEPTTATERFYGKQITRQLLLDSTGEGHTFYFYDLQPSVVVMVVTTEREVVLVREFKQGSDQIQEGFVGGYVKKGKTADLTAIDEVRQETGYLVGQLIPLGNMWPLPRHSSGEVELYLALGCELVGEPKPDQGEETEEIEVVKISLKEWLERLQTGETQEGFSAITTWRAFPHLGLKVTV